MYWYSMGNPGTYPRKNITWMDGKCSAMLYALGMAIEKAPDLTRCSNPLYAHHSSLETPSGYSTMKNVYRAHTMKRGTVPRSLKK